MADTKTPTPGQIVIMAGGAVALVGSFLKFTGVEDFGTSSWGEGYFPVVTLMTIFAVISAVVVALRFVNVSMPERVLGFTWPQLHLILGFFAALYAVAFLIVELGTDRKIGFWLVLIGCVASLVGAIMLTKEAPATGRPGGTVGPGTGTV